MSEKPICGQQHQNLENVKCGRVASAPRAHHGPCAKVVTLEWYYNQETGRMERSAVVNGRVEDLEVKHGGPFTPDEEVTAEVELPKPDEEGDAGE